MRRRWTTIAASIVILIATLAAAPLLKTNFIDQSGQTTLSITQTMPVGTSLTATDAAAQQVEKVLAADKEAGELVSYQATVGGGAVPGLGGSGNQATFSVTVEEGTDVTAVQDRLEERLAGLKNAGEIVVGGASPGSAAPTSR